MLPDTTDGLLRSIQDLTHGPMTEQAVASMKGLLAQERGLAQECNGYWILTKAGVRLAIDVGLLKKVKQRTFSTTQNSNPRG